MIQKVLFRIYNIIFLNVKNLLAPKIVCVVARVYTEYLLHQNNLKEVTKQENI